MEARVEEAHAGLSGLNSAQAENRYLEKVKWLDMYGVDLHPVIVSPKLWSIPMTKYFCYWWVLLLYKIPDICCQLREGRVVCVALELFNIDNFLSQS